MTIRKALAASPTANLRAVLLAASLFFSNAAFAGDATVKIDNFTFDPPRLTVKAGTTVTWYNEDDIPHTVAATGKTFRSKALDTDGKFSFTFTTAGSYPYKCVIHPGMIANIIVR